MSDKTKVEMRRNALGDNLARAVLPNPNFQVLSLRDILTDLKALADLKDSDRPDLSASELANLKRTAEVLSAMKAVDRDKEAEKIIEIADKLQSK